MRWYPRATSPPNRVTVTEPLVTLEVTETAAIIRLNRPARHNALVPGLLQELLDALNDERCRNTTAVILAAEGQSFSTGGDLLGFWQHRDDIADYSQRLVGLLNQVVLALYTHPVPVACAVQGQVTGGSLGLLLAADRVIMHRQVTITPWYAAVGFSPDGGWTAMLPDVIGREQSGNWLLSNATFAADQCLAIGLAHELVTTDVMSAALAWSDNIAGMSAASIGSTRSLLRGDAAEIRRRLDAERAAFVQQVQTPEAIAGIARFLGK